MARRLDIDRGSSILVSSSSAKGQDLAYVVHNCISVHGVCAVATITGGSDCAVAGSGYPVHLLARTGLKRRPVGLPEQPDVIISPVDAGGVRGQNLTGKHTRKKPPAPCCAARGEYLAVFSAGHVVPRTAERQHLARGKGGGTIVGPGNVQARAYGPGIGHRILNSRRVIVATADYE